MNQQFWLTSDIVEQLQQAAEVGKPVSSFVESLKRATLPGLLEYGCARWHNKSLPALPPSITQSMIGQALSEVKSELGLRFDGPQKSAPRTMVAFSFEFIVLHGEEAPVHQDWREFLIRFRQSAKSVGFSMDQAKGLAASLGEMADNASYHANAPNGVLIGYQTIRGAVVCCVVDVGDGVLKSLKTHPAYQNLEHHNEAIRVALHKGESRYGPKSGGGLGFYRVFKSLAAMWGTLRFRSGEGCVTMDGRGIDADNGEDSYVFFRPGFQVTICCRTSGTEDTIPLV
jgi:anti-sigma regulatory factor (Ser/Thr protein kinase)